MAQDLPPVPIQSQITDGYGTITRIWSEWFRNLMVSSTRANSGTLSLPGGITIQWGVTASLNSATSTAITFPTAFAASCMQVIAGVRDNSAVATAATGQWGTGNYSASGFNLYNRTSVALTFNWFAVGY